jgi:hypothetical protein
VADVLEWLNDPILANCVAIISLVVTVAAFVRGRSGKSIRMRVIGDIPLIRTYGGFGKLVKINLNGISLQNARFFVVQIENDGSEPVRSADVESPLTIHCGPAASVIGQSIREKHPHDLKVEASIDAGSIRLNLPLLNPGDRFEVSSIVADAKKDITVEGRIAGLTLAGLEQQHRRLYVAFVLLLTLGLVYNLVAVGVFFCRLGQQFRWVYLASLALNIGVAGYFCTVIVRKLLRCQYE